MRYVLPTGTEIIPESDSGILNRPAMECRNPKEREPLRALCTLSIGYSADDVSKMFYADEDTVYRWTQRWSEERSVEDRGRNGRLPTP